MPTAMEAWSHAFIAIACQCQPRLLWFCIISLSAVLTPLSASPSAWQGSAAASFRYQPNSLVSLPISVTNSPTAWFLTRSTPTEFAGLVRSSSGVTPSTMKRRNELDMTEESSYTQPCLITRSTHTSTALDSRESPSAIGKSRYRRF